MPGVRRSDLTVEAARRAHEQRLRIGAEIRTMRERRGWTRTQLADRAGVGRMVVSRIERGQTGLDLDVLQRIGLACVRPSSSRSDVNRAKVRSMPATSPCRN
jgi:transcriptional regulator with XRE-family HTH domain